MSRCWPILSIELACSLATFPELLELDLNPVIASVDGIAAVDVRMRVHRADDTAVPIRGLRNSPRTPGERGAGDPPE
jgi:hypothetical protein